MLAAEERGELGALAKFGALCALVLLLLSFGATPARGFETQFPGLTFAPIHQDMTGIALNFLRPNVLDDIVDEHRFVETRFALDSSYHFDNCAFFESTQNINGLYFRAIGDLNPAAPDLEDAPDAFGQLLHPVQDFYSHSNWIELGKKTLVDNGFGFWITFGQLSIVQGVVVVEGTDADFGNLGVGLVVDRVRNIVKVVSPGGQISDGLVSGTFGGGEGCPESASISHDALNKDGPLRPRHGPARALATTQTAHEWCRLVNLVKQSYGRPGVKFLFDNWVADTNKAISVCPNADIAFVIDTTGSMFDDIAAVKAASASIINALGREPVIVRLALATFKDFPVGPFGGPSDFPFRANSVFSLGDDVRPAIGSLTTGGGADIPESVYTALMQTIGGSLGAWRPDANVKAIILMGDAPPHDPEPFTGFTLSTVLAAAEAADPIVIHAVPVGFSPSAHLFFTALAEGTGGGVFTASTAADVPDAIIRAIQEVLESATDVTPPAISAPPDITVECNVAGGAAGVDLETPTVSDDKDSNPVVANDAPSLFPLGTNSVTWTATDSSGNSASATQSVTVLDTIPPSIIVPDDFFAIAESAIGAAVDIGEASVSDVCDPSPVVTNDAPNVFPPGTTRVTWTATDSIGNMATATQSVRVLTPRDLKDIAVADLRAIRETIGSGVDGVGRPGKAAEEIDEAIEDVTKSLKPRRWGRTDSGDIDPFRLESERGREVFRQERHAVAEIFDAIKRGKITDPAILADLLAVVDKLVEADRLLAQVALDDAKANPTSDPEEDDDDDDEDQDEAEESLAEGIRLIGLARSEADLVKKDRLISEAIKRFSHAWDEATEADDDDEDDDDEDDDD